MNDLASFLSESFDSVEPQGDFEIIPPGKYTVLIEKSEVKKTKKGTGHYIDLVLQVLDGKFKNRKVFHRINIDNPSQQCVQIGMRVLAALRIASGIQNITDSGQLINKVVVAHVKVKGEQNEVRTYSAVTPSQPLNPEQTHQTYQTEQAPEVSDIEPIASSQQSALPSPNSKPIWAR